MRFGLAEYVDALGGLPFVDASFKPATLLAVAAGVRRRWDTGNAEPLESYLNPDKAGQIFALHGKVRSDEPASRPLTKTQAAAVAKALELVVSARPDWQVLFELPVYYMALLDNRMSLTSAVIPQVIFLGVGAVNDEEILADVLVHEYSHLWLHLIAETSDLQVLDASEEFTLPSGTTGKPVRGVLLAAHFAAATHAYHLARSNYPRAAYLLDYLNGCLAMLNGSQEITAMGQFVKTRLEAYAGAGARKS